MRPCLLPREASVWVAAPERPRAELGEGWSAADVFTGSAGRSKRHASGSLPECLDFTLAKTILVANMKFRLLLANTLRNQEVRRCPFDRLSLGRNRWAPLD